MDVRDLDSIKRHIRIALASLPEKNKLWFLFQMETYYGFLERATARRVARQQWLGSIRECNENGVVALIEWSRDCDMCEATTRTEVEAVPWVIEEIMNERLAWAEGPTRFRIQRMSDPFEYEFRDLAMEAHENGHRHVIHA